MSRVDLHKKLTSVMSSEGVKLYFQPPTNITMDYPCIVYDVKDIDTEYADGTPYFVNVAYQLMLITKQPDEAMTTKLLMNVPFIRFDRSYISNNLYHYVFTCYEKLT